MDDEKHYFFVGLLFGLGCAGLLFTVLIGWRGGLHNDHIEDYKACLAIGAPQQNCFDKYLVEKKHD